MFIEKVSYTYYSKRIGVGQPQVCISPPKIEKKFGKSLRLRTFAVYFTVRSIENPDCARLQD
jgi:hypothetical protein